MNEAQLRISLRIAKGEGIYQSQPTAFNVDVASGKGPSPGSLTIPVTGRVVDFTELESLGLCRIQNKDPTNIVKWGIYDSNDGQNYTPFEIYPGESYVIRLSDDLRAEFVGTGTGSVDNATLLFFRAMVAPCEVLIEAFEK